MAKDLSEELEGARKPLSNPDATAGRLAAKPRYAPIGDRTIDVSEGDLCVIAEHGYEGADTICIRKPSASSSPTCPPPRSARVTALRRSQRRFSRPENSAVPARPPAAAPPAGGSAPKRPFLSATFELVPSWKTRFSSQPLDLAAKFSLASEFKANVALFGFEDDLRFALAHDSPGGWSQSGRV